MTYALALKLKESGFKQTGKGRTLCNRGLDSLDRSCGVYGLFGEIIFKPLHDCKGHIYHPTLDELIDILGDDFISLSKHNGNKEWNDWCAIGGNKKVLRSEQWAEFPEIAVANLYLELNKKSL